MGNIFEDIEKSFLYFRNLRRKEKISVDDVKVIHVFGKKDDNYDYEDKLNKGDKK